WLERCEKLTQLGGPPETGPEPGLDPILFGPDPTARAKVFLEREQWDAAEAAFDEATRARPHNASIWLERGRFDTARLRPGQAARDFAQAIRRGPEDLSLRYAHVLSLLALGDEAGVRRACSELLDRFGAATAPGPANDVAWYCVLSPGAVADPEAPVR